MVDAAAGDYVQPGMMGDIEAVVAQQIVVFAVGTNVFIALGKKVYNAVWDSCAKRYQPTR